jgi:hypothetical protein
MSRRILVTGSRTWTDHTAIRQALTWYRSLYGPSTTVVHGGCPQGADAIADRLADELGLQVERHPADWHTYGKRAGYVRNTRMVNLGADVCLAFIRNGSPGASMCASYAALAGIPVTHVRQDR